MARLTPDVQQQIVAFLRAGGFPDVAAQAAGVGPDQFARWLQRGRQPGEPRRYRLFAEAVAQAIAQARLAAEVEAHGKRPLDWLRAGPARGEWGAAAEPAAGPPGLEHPELRAAFAALLAALEPFPEARAAAAKALGG